MLEKVEKTPQITGQLLDVGMLIIDEAHHAMSKSYEEVIGWMRSKYKDVFVLFLTATPFRGDGQELSSVSQLLFRFSLAEAMTLKYTKQVCRSNPPHERCALTNRRPLLP